MALLKLRPSYKDYLWGGHRLVEKYNKEFDGDILAESWELSCHPDGHFLCCKWFLCRQNIAGIH